MRRVVILAELPDAATLRAGLGDADACVISLTPRLSEQLDLVGISSRPASAYAQADGWEDVHAALWRALAGDTGDDSPLAPPWLHDWSHFLVDELRADLYWARVAQRIVERERPIELLLQRVSPESGSAGGVSALATGFDLLGQQWSHW